MSFGQAKTEGFNNPVIKSFQVADIILNEQGLFLFNTNPPTPGSLVFSVATAPGTIKGNSYLAGLFIYETGGNALIGLIWNSFVGGQPLLALFPDSSFGFAGHSPFIFSGDNNKGLAAENQFLALGPGNPPPAVASNTMLELIGGSRDGTTVIPHMAIFAGATYTNIADFNALVTTCLELFGLDGNVYTPGHLLMIATQTTINNVTPIPITGLSCQVLNGKSYRVSGSLRVVAAGGGVTQAFGMQFNGTCTLSACRIRTRTYQEANSITPNAGTISALGATGANTGVIANSAVYSVDFDGIITASGSGSFHADGLQITSAADETFTVQGLSFMELIPQ